MTNWLKHSLCCVSLVVSGFAGAEELLVYTAIESEWLPVYKSAFEKRYPDIKISFLRGSAGPISARLVAEKDNPKADVVFGLSAIAMENLTQQGLLETYKPINAESLNSKMHNKDFAWFGMNAWGGSICVNTELLARKNIPIPKNWEDLTKPIYKNLIVMPSPLASSTGYMFFIGWIQGFGEQKGWEYFDRLHKNILFYSSSGARPAAMVSQGEIPIGLSSAAFIKPFLRYNIPVITVEPSEGIAWDAEASGLTTRKQNIEAARKFLDFCASKEVGAIAAKFSGISAIDSYSTTQGHNIAKQFLPLDFQRAANEKVRIIKRWQQKVSE